MKKLKDILNEVLSEDKRLQTKIFDQGSLNDTAKQIKKLINYEEEQYGSQSFDYDEFRFSDGHGGFSFKWEHGVKHFGRLGVSIQKDGNHYLYAVSYYDGKKFGDEKIDPKRLPTPQKDFLRHIKTWKDLDNLTMQTIVTVLSKDVIKNEADANKAFEQDRKAQSDFYGSGGKGYYKQDGRIGAGL